MIPDLKNRTVTFNKRKVGLMKKAIELSVLCGVDVALVVFGKDTIYKYASRDLEELMGEYDTYSGPVHELSKDDLEDLEEGKLGSKFEKKVKRCRADANGSDNDRSVPAAKRAQQQQHQQQQHQQQLLQHQQQTQMMALHIDPNFDPTQIMDFSRKRMPGLHVMLPPSFPPASTSTDVEFPMSALYNDQRVIGGFSPDTENRAPIGDTNGNYTAGPSDSILAPWATMYNFPTQPNNPNTTGNNSSNQYRVSPAGFPAGFTMSPITCWMLPSPTSAVVSNGPNANNAMPGTFPPFMSRQYTQSANSFEPLPDKIEDRADDAKK